MSSARYTAEFKAEAVKQVTERGHGVVEVAKRLGRRYWGDAYPDSRVCSVISNCKGLYLSLDDFGWLF